MPEETMMREDGHETHEDDGNIPGLPPFPEGMPEEMKQQLREAHENGGGLGAMILGAILGRARRDPNEEMREGVRRALDASPDEATVNLRFSITSAVRADGTEILLSSAQLQDHDEEKALVETRDFLQAIVAPVLRPGEGVRVRMLDLTLGQMVERASQTWDLPAFEEHVLLMQADSEHEARVRKFEECQDCGVEDCDRRITERPTRDDEDEPTE
jgi:hypothetical protein